MRYKLTAQSDAGLGASRGGGTASKVALDFGTLLAAMRKGKMSKDGVLSFSVCINTGYFGLHGLAKNGSAKFLFREEYYRLLDEILTHFGTESMTNLHAIVCGTSGTGKSAFRIFMILKWLVGEIDLGCNEILVNFNGDRCYLLVDKEGNVRQVPSTFQDKDIVALLDPCKILSAKEPYFKRVVATTSPSPSAGQDEKHNMSEFGKVARIFVMQIWTVWEFNLLEVPCAESKLLNLSFLEDGVRYCVPRWLIYDDIEFDGQINRCLKDEFRVALFDFFLSNVQVSVKDKRIPYRLCVIALAPGGNDFVAVRFISDKITQRALIWAASGAEVKRQILTSLIQNPFSQGLVGTWFENWAFSALTLGKKSLSISQAGLDVRFESLKQFPGLPKSSRNREQVTFEPGVLYRAENRSWPSIDGFGIVDDKLMMPAEWIDVDHIVKAAQQVNQEVQLYLIYVVHDIEKFKAPDCPSLVKNNCSVCVGMVADDFYPNFVQDLKNQTGVCSSVFPSSTDVPKQQTETRHSGRLAAKRK